MSSDKEDYARGRIVGRGHRRGGADGGRHGGGGAGAGCGDVGGRGNWTTEGCVISGGGPDSTGTVTCSCNHLTNFGVQVVSVCTVI